MIWLLLPLGLLLCAGLWQLLMEQDEPARITQADLDEARTIALQEDCWARMEMASTRASEYLKWRVRFREAEHLRAVQRFKGLRIQPSGHIDT